MFNLFNKRKKVNPQQMGEGLWMFCKKISKEFYVSFKPVIEKVGIKLDQNSEVDLSREIIIMNLWIISKALSPDKKTLNELHKIYIFGHANIAETEEEKINFPKHAEKELNNRYKKYYETWDEKSGSNQSVIAITILEQLLNSGKPSKKFVNIMLTSFIIMHVMGMLKAVLKFRKNFEIIK